MRLKLKLKSLFEKSGLGNIHQLSLKSMVSAQTAYKYVNNPEDVKAVDFGVLASILMDGLEMTPEDVLKMPLGDLFEIVED